MKKRWLLLFLALVVLVGVGAAFLFGRSKPKYCWLVFGPEAKVRILVCLDGKAVYIDRDGDGKFDGEGERFNRLEDCKDVVIADPDGKTSYVITKTSSTGFAKPPWIWFNVEVDIKGPLEYSQMADPELAAEPKNAPMAHFHGPLTVIVGMWEWDLEADHVRLKQPSLTLQTGENPTQLYVMVATQDSEQRVGAGVRTVRDDRSPIFPKEVHPFMDVEFPCKRKGDPPIKKRYPLDKVC